MQSRAQHTREHQLQPLYCTVRHVLHVSAWHMSSMMAWNALCVQPVLHMDTMHWPAVPVVHSSGEAAHASCIKCILNRSLAARIGSIINIGTDTSCLLLPPPPNPCSRSTSHALSSIKHKTVDPVAGAVSGAASAVSHSAHNARDNLTSKGESIVGQDCCQ
jgi:hypothetical protein